MGTVCLYHSEFSQHLWRPCCVPNTRIQHGQTSEPSKRMPSDGQNVEINHERQILTRAIVEGQRAQWEYRGSKD